MKKLTICMVSLVLLFTSALVGCSNSEGNSSSDPNAITELPQYSAMESGEQIAIMHTNYGDLKIRFFPEIAPKAVENFITHAENGYYNGLTFHRVVKDFVIQGGDPEGTGAGGTSIWGTPFEDEFSYQLRNFYGCLSMANSGSNTNGSQFFFVTTKEVSEDNLSRMRDYGEPIYPDIVIDKYEEVGGQPGLDLKHTVFGQVYEGLDVLDTINGVEVNGESPVSPVVIESIEITTY
jgi:peptidyl-prolyl cis-trans isomerase B (cyclophilin B)